MEITNCIECLKKWNKDYPKACLELMTQIEQMSIDLKGVPVEMILELHEAIAADMRVNINEMTGAVDDIVEVRFEDLPIQSQFFRGGKKYVKLNNEYMLISVANCKCLDNEQEQRFKPDSKCILHKVTVSSEAR